MKKQLLLLLVLASLIFVPHVTFAQNDPIDSTGIFYGIFASYVDFSTQKCSIPTLSAAEKTCLYGKLVPSLTVCSKFTDATAIKNCLSQTLQKNGPAISSCAPTITDTQKTCVTGAAATAVSNVATNGSGAQPQTNQPAPSLAGKFIPLTNIPAVKELQANGFAGFFNQIYVLAVGIASVIAVLQFIRAGVMYSLSDTGVTEKREARHLMVISVLGLILVLSPTLVFSIINPKILTLQIGTEALGPGGNSTNGGGGTNPSTTDTGGQPTPGGQGTGGTTGGSPSCPYAVTAGDYITAYAIGFNNPYDTLFMKGYADAQVCQKDLDVIQAAEKTDNISRFFYYQCEQVTKNEINLVMPDGITSCLSPN